jgi:hypothetical protein
MAYEIDLQTMDNYVRVHVTGERRYGDAAMEASQAGQKIVEYCRQTDIYRVLVVLNLRGRLSAIDSLEIVTSSQEYGWDYSFKLAFVDTNNSSFDDVKFTETVAVNRAYSVKAFNDEAKAVDWLLDRPA